jgi:hypothetical protein
MPIPSTSIGECATSSWNQAHFLNLGLQVVEFEKNMLQPKSEGLKIGRTGLYVTGSVSNIPKNMCPQNVGPIRSVVEG